MEAVLVLNADYTLLEIVSWQKAVNLFFRGKVRIVEQFSGRFLRSPSVTIEFPAVVAHTQYVHQRRVRFSRRNILARDSYTCQYCGVRPKKKSGAPNLEDLTLDHVIARSSAVNGWVSVPWAHGKVRVTSWENILTACIPCNSKKADLTLRKARMKMKKQPKAPSVRDIAYMALAYDIDRREVAMKARSAVNLHLDDMGVAPLVPG